MTRHKTYQTHYGFVTIDSQTETPPEEYIAVFDNTELDEVKIRAGGADITVDDGLVIDSPMTDKDAKKILNEELTIAQWREDNPDAVLLAGNE